MSAADAYRLPPPSPSHREKKLVNMTGTADGRMRSHLPTRGGCATLTIRERLRFARNPAVRLVRVIRRSVSSSAIVRARVDRRSRALDP